MTVAVNSFIFSGAGAGLDGLAVGLERLIKKFLDVGTYTGVSADTNTILRKDLRLVVVDLSFCVLPNGNAVDKGTLIGGGHTVSSIKIQCQFF
jgi:hypothetical protein